MQPFSYAPLDRDRNEIRLLRLHASSEDSKAIVGQLAHVSLDGNPQYEALSYTWGDDGRTRSITLSGSTFDVTENLFTALSALQLSNSNRLLWIDAICINQEDISERNQEVLRMLSIYRSAAQVVVWLGRETNNTTLAIDHLRRLSKEWESEHDRGIIARIKRASNSIFVRYLAVMQTLVDNIRSRPLMMTLAVIYAFFFTPAPSGIVSFLLRMLRAWSFIVIGFRSVRVYVTTMNHIIDEASMPDPNHIKALMNLFSSPWFGRVWIVQEIAAARSATLLCGKSAISWREFSRACDQIQRLIARTSVRNTYVDCGFEHIRVVQSAFDPNRPSDERTQVKWRMLFLLAQFSNFESTDPRDKIYGLLGLARESQEQDEESARMIPDYNKPLATIFAEVVMFVVSRMDSLDILRACEGFHRMPGLPSWAPDWTCHVKRTIGAATSRTISYRLRSDPTPGEPVAKFLDVPLTMTVRGFEIGQLVDSGKLLFTVPDPQFSEKMRARTFGFVDIMFKYFLPYFEWIVKSGLFGFCLKMPLKTMMWFLPETKDRLEPYFGLIDDIVKDVKNTPGGHDEESISRVTENLFKFFVDPRMEPMNLLSIAWKPSLRRVTMDSGRCHAFVKDPQPGDLVCMFVGASEPHILRRYGQHYRLLNTATFGPFNRTLWLECEREYGEGTLPLRVFNLR